MKPGLHFIVIVFFLSSMVIGFSCNKNNNNTVENVVYYYPEKNIYYDELSSNYYYSLDSARTWDSMNFKGAGYGAVLGPKVPVKRAGENIWLNNVSHRKEHDGVLLNIINNYTVSLSRSDRINKLRAVVKSETQPKVIEKEPPPPEKGLKKFFRKLFGKKKKPAEEKKKPAEEKKG